MTASLPRWREVPLPGRPGCPPSSGGVAVAVPAPTRASMSTPLETGPLSQRLQDADVVRHARSSHVADAAEPRPLDLHPARVAADLHRAHARPSLRLAL